MSPFTSIYSSYMQVYQTWYVQTYTQPHSQSEHKSDASKCISYRKYSSLRDPWSIMIFFCSQFLFQANFLAGETRLRSYEHWLLFRRVQVQLPAPRWWLSTIHNSSPRASGTLFWPLQAPHTHLVHKYTHRQNIQMHKIIDKSLREKSNHQAGHCDSCM